MITEIWDTVLDNVQSKINKQSFNTWLKDTEPHSILGNTIKIMVPDEIARKHIIDHYLLLISDILNKSTGKNFLLEFIIQNGNSNPDEISYNKTTANTQSNETSFMLNPRYTFDNFVVGPNNQLAHAASLSVSSSPANKYNPLFIYGGSGLGKTHLLQAIGHRVNKEKPFLNVLYVTSEDFVNELIQTIRNRTVESFKIKYRDVDILLIDDIQFIEKKEQTQIEFFHTFNTLHHNKKQIVISSDRPPKELSTLEDRLRTRFEWGLITDIHEPNLETREAILRNKAEETGMIIDDDVFNYIAKRIRSNIRKLESALARLDHVIALSNEPITIQLVKTHLRELFDADTNTKISINDIITKISEKFEVPFEDIISKSRQSIIVQPRFIAMYISRNLTNLTTSEIGKEFGNRDHSTVLNAMSNIEKSMKENEEFKEQIEDIIIELKS